MAGYHCILSSNAAMNIKQFHEDGNECTLCGAHCALSGERTSEAATADELLATAIDDYGCVFV